MQARTRIGHRYAVTHPIGRGAMGEVWAGLDKTLDRPVAIKLLRRETLDGHDRKVAVERFMREARAAARLDHVGVPTVYDIGVHDDEIYIVMKLVSGMVLCDLLAERGPLPVRWVAAIGAQTCSVLAAAHAASLVHRDLKPQNIMVTPAGVVTVLDFGVAALLDAADMSRLTLTGEMIGTPVYIAPEQAAAGVVGPEADLYALGCVLHELLTGRPPYAAETPLGLLHAHLHAPVPSVVAHREDVPEGLVDLVVAMLAKEPARRPGSASDVYRTLLPWSTGGVDPVHQPSPPGRWEPGDPTLPYRYPFGWSNASGRPSR